MFINLVFTSPTVSTTHNLVLQKILFSVFILPGQRWLKCAVNNCVIKVIKPNIINYCKNMTGPHNLDDSNFTATPLPTTKHVVHWFRKGLRIHDNPSLRRAISNCTTFRCIFILDPYFAGSSNIGINKWR